MLRVGLERLLAQGLSGLGRARVGLVTNHTGLDRAFRAGPDLLARSDVVRLAALFAPEHGLRGEAQASETVPTTRDPGTGLPVHSLYGEHREPTPECLAGLDALLVDLQDIGVRYATYAATLVACLRAAARAGMPVVVLDRPNPLSGLAVVGDLPEPVMRSYVAAVPTPILHGLTLAEVARCCRDTWSLDVDLRTVPMTGWRRDRWADQTGWPWLPPSPNLPTLTAVTLYPGTCLVEGTTLSEGRGTTTPFEVIGAPWVDPPTLRRALDTPGVAGAAYREAWFVPTFGKHAGLRCGGVQVHVLDRASLHAPRLGLHLLAACRRLWPAETAWTTGEDGLPWLDALCGTDRVRIALDDRVGPDEIVAGWAESESRFRAARADWLLYGE